MQMEEIKQENNLLSEDQTKQQQPVEKDKKRKKKCVQCELEKKLGVKILQSQIVFQDKNLDLFQQSEQESKPEKIKIVAEKKSKNLNELKYKYLYSQLYLNYEKKKQQKNLNSTSKSSKMLQTTQDPSFEGKSFNRKLDSVNNTPSIFQSKIDSPQKNSLLINASKQNQEINQNLTSQQEICSQEQFNSQLLSQNQQMNQNYQLSPGNLSVIQPESNSSFDFLLSSEQQVSRSQIQSSRFLESQEIKIKDLNDSLKSSDFSQDLNSSQQIVHLQKSINKFQKQIEDSQKQRYFLSEIDAIEWNQEEQYKQAQSNQMGESIQQNELEKLNNLIDIKTEKTPEVSLQKIEQRYFADFQEDLNQSEQRISVQALQQQSEIQNQKQKESSKSQEVKTTEKKQVEDSFWEFFEIQESQNIKQQNTQTKDSLKEEEDKNITIQNNSDQGKKSSVATKKRQKYHNPYLLKLMIKLVQK